MSTAPRALAALLFTGVLAAPGTATSPGPAALALGPDCLDYAERYTLVRNDVLAKLDAADQNLPKAEAALKQAQEDIQALKSAVDTLADQKTLLQGHISVLEELMKKQPAKPFDLEAAWEFVDGPISFAAGAGMCMGIVWGLRYP